jgi:hypothetical protein
MWAVMLRSAHRFVLRSALLALMFVCALAAAQMRAIPAEAKRAAIRHVQENVVEINGTQVLLSPGAQIRDTENRLLVPGVLTDSVLAKYLFDAQGQVWRIWVLTPAEAAEPDPR